MHKAAISAGAVALGLFATIAPAAPIAGDLNGDGVVNAADFALLAPCLGGPGVAPPGCSGLSLDADDDLDLRDFGVFARAWQTVDCAAVASASSAEASPLYDAFNAIDGLRSTRWASGFADNQWLQVDLGRPRILTGAVIHWENAHARSYQLRVSTNGVDFASVYSTMTGDGGQDEIAFPPVTARYVRLNCLQRATPYGFSVWELELALNEKCGFDGRDPEARIDALLAEMTLAEKVSLLYGETGMSLRAIPRLRIPALQMADGPLGARWGQATAFPAPIALASAWDGDLAERFGKAIGAEWRNKGRQVWLGPGMNILRVPQCGRNFEYFSEDPFLAARLAAGAVRGAQSAGVIACAKHYACNNQEQNRTTVNVQVDERTLREIYLPAFEACVREAGVWSVMAAYNRVNGAYCTANAHLLDEILKDEWGFNGFVVSDWGAVHETVGPALAGMDLEMDGANPSGTYWGSDKLLNAVQSGAVPVELIDDKVRRILRALLATGIMDAPWDSPNRPMNEHNSLVREIARSGIVLLKNEGSLLPLDPQASQTIAVLGSRYATAGTGGGGSSAVTPYYSVSPLQGLRSAAGVGVTFIDKPGVSTSGGYTAAPSSYLSPLSGSGNGLTGEYFNNRTLAGLPALTRVDATVDFNWGAGSPHPSVASNNFSVRWRGRLTVPAGGAWTIGMATDDGCRVYLDGELIVDDWTNHAAHLSAASVTLTAGQPYDLVLEYYEAEGDASAVFVCQQNLALGEAVAAAQAADVALVFVGLDATRESEGFDRASIDLTSEEVALIKGVAAVNPNTAVIIVAGSQVGFDAWIDDVPAVVQAWYGGQEAGNAIADVVFGAVSPSGKLPMSFVRRWEDHPAYGLYPSGSYSDGIYVGYRHFDRPGVTPPLFPFGHGLSYTTFAYSNQAIDTSAMASEGLVRVSFEIENAGSRAGVEIAQVYVRDVQASVPRPVKELKGFARLMLAPGERKSATVTLDRRAFAFYDVASGGWTVEPGQFEILVGASSQDIRLTETLQIDTIGGAK